MARVMLKSTVRPENVKPGKKKWTINRLTEKPAHILIGGSVIAKYMGCSYRTIYRWRKHLNFPACKLPNGRLAISPAQIDQWLMARYLVQTNGRPHRP